MSSGAHPAGRMRPSVVLYWGATGVIALHAAVDSFIAPEPGTTPRDHLLRGTVSLLLLAGAAAAFPRLRAGGRAVLAGSFGLLALEGAGLAIADARAVGARGEDWTGFLLVPVGIILSGLATHLVWRSRKPGRYRWVRRGGLTLATLIGAYVLIVPVAVAILATHRPRAAVEPVDLGRPYRTVTVTTRDGLRLAGWYVPSRNGAAVISYPTRIGQTAVARMLVRHGYGVLLLDARGYDGSQGDPNMFGWGDTTDIDAAVGWLLRRPEVRDGRIGGIGFSVGGEMMLQAAAENHGLRAVVSEGAGIRSLREELLYGVRSAPALPQQAAMTAALTILSGTSAPPSLDRLSAEIAPRSVFFIYAEDGTGGEELNRTYYRSAGQPKQIWRIPGSTHTGGFLAQPRQYEHRVAGFFDRALLPIRGPEQIG